MHFPAFLHSLHSLESFLIQHLHTNVAIAHELFGIIAAAMDLKRDAAFLLVPLLVVGVSQPDAAARVAP